MEVLILIVNVNQNVKNACMLSLRKNVNEQQ